MKKKTQRTEKFGMKSKSQEIEHRHTDIIEKRFIFFFHITDDEVNAFETFS